ncbi:uncharacterized protein LOC125788904 isoform X1 [Astyanax mexicanus]|uniref:uncharacterized protein LOC125788904 isoform X1 n=1 Tax=Astyanax mexicanus TaxID=7994 RepID=UPI0020CB0BE9|nr:uncharacterized protein LOC125788904 isoform X1 [Astyanax mexicanus]
MICSGYQICSHGTMTSSYTDTSQVVFKRSLHANKYKRSIVHQTWSESGNRSCERYCPYVDPTICMTSTSNLFSSFSYANIYFEWTLYRQSDYKTIRKRCMASPENICDQPANCFNSARLKRRPSKLLRCSIALLMSYFLTTNPSTRARYTYFQVEYRSMNSVAFLIDTKGTFSVKAYPIGTNCSHQAQYTLNAFCEPLLCYEQARLNRTPRAVVHSWEAQRLFTFDSLNPNDLPDTDNDPGVVISQYAEQNMFYQYLTYTAQSVASTDCLACHNGNSVPTITPIDGLDDVTNRTVPSPLQCLMSSLNIPNQHSIVDPICTDIDSPIVPPPPIIRDTGAQYPFCFCRPTTRHNLPELDHRYRTRLTPTGTDILTGRRYLKVNLANGTLPLADLFWICQSDTKLLQSLTNTWTGCCAPVTLTGSVSVMTFDDTLPRHKRDLYSLPDISDIQNVPELNYLGIPVKIPKEHLVMSDGSIGATGILFAGMQAYRNGHWINYIWYNQQRFLNHTITALEALGEQLDATSKMTLQNRFAIDQMRAPDDGVCVLIGDECCSYIPLHTGSEGNFTKVMSKLRKLRDEHVRNTQAVQTSWFNWLFSGQWKALLMRMAMMLLYVILILMFVACCVVPCLRMLVERTISSISGQYAVFHASVDSSAGLAVTCHMGQGKAG